MTQASSQIEEAGGQPPEDGGRRNDGRDDGAPVFRFRVSGLPLLVSAGGLLASACR